MHKTFKPLGESIIALYSSIIVAFAIVVGLGVLFLSLNIYFFAIIFFAISVYIFYYIILSLFKFPYIKFTKNTIISFQNDKREIKYSDIEDIRLICSVKNEKKQIVDKSKNIPYFYLEFSIKDQESFWQDFASFSIRQREKIIEIIASKTGLNKSYGNLVKDYLQAQVDGTAMK